MRLRGVSIGSLKGLLTFVFGLTVVPITTTVLGGFFLNGFTFGGVGIIHPITVTIGAFLPSDLV